MRDCACQYNKSHNLCFRTGVIWQVARKRGLWKTLNNTVIAHLEDAYQRQQPDVNIKNLVVSMTQNSLMKSTLVRYRSTLHR